MKPIDIIIIAILSLILIGVIAYIVWKKKTGENVGCGCGCNGCSGCSSANVCPTAQKAEEEQAEEQDNKPLQSEEETL